MAVLDRASFQALQHIVAELCGLIIRDDQEYLIVHRLENILKRFGLADWQELAKQLQQQPSSELVQAVLHEITTHETSFFRDRHPWEMLQQHILPDLADRGPISACCLAASTGQEVYSLAMVLEELRASRPSLQWSIQAKDISQQVIEYAARGCYSRRHLDRGLDDKRRQRFACETGPDEWTFIEALRRPIRWRQANLMDGQAVPFGCNLILCRNVLIYFSPERQQELIDRFIAALKPGGYLLLGATETFAIGDRGVERLSFKPSVIYRKKT